MARRPRLFLSSLAFAALLPAHAAELGDPRVVSHIGQPLVADIELTMLEDAATPVQVRVASPEVYNGAGIAVPPVLSSLNLSVMRRDGRQFLHVTSLRSVDGDHVHLYLELVDKGQRAVRLATLWLTPDPTPASASARVPAPVVVPAPSQDAVLLAQVERARTAPSVAADAPPARVVKVPRPHPAPVAKAPAPPAAHAAACAIPAGEAQACAALGAKNDALRTRLGQVEDRMKKLQVSLAAPVAAPPPAEVGAPKPAQPVTPAAAPEPARSVVPAGPRPIHSIKPLVPHKLKTAAPPPDESLPWGWIGAAIGVLALGGAGAFVLVRRRGAKAAAAPGLFGTLKARFAARARAPKEGGAEPTID
ncbi:type IV pilus assembly protein FimV [Massilia putida]|uniref:type IV pilus assembly protein FimV n=1 Tax=Massilia putida TaxID=1141883 RepID=UPI000951AC0E|nr:hypothetical protein [Massilia putida]